MMKQSLSDKTSRPGLTRFRGHALLRLVVLAALLLICGCGGVPVAQDLTQRQATEIVAVLNQNGISSEAARGSGTNARYSVAVSRALYARAIELLHEKGLPSEDHASFDELISQHGIIPNSREIEALRLDRAMAAEIEEALRSLPGVTSLRVVVRQRSLPPSDELSGQQAAVSAVVQKSSAARLGVEEIKQLVMRLAPGIPEDRVFVMLQNRIREHAPALAVEGTVDAGGAVVRFPLTRFLWLWQVPEEEYNSLALAMCAGLMLVLSLGTLLGFGYARFRYGRRPARPFYNSGLGASMPKAAAIRATKALDRESPRE